MATNIADTASYTLNNTAAWSGTSELLYDDYAPWHDWVSGTIYVSWEDGTSRFISADLGSAKTIESFSVQFMSGNDPPDTLGKDVVVYYSDNGADYTEIGTYQTANYQNPTETPRFDMATGSTTHRYYRFSFPNSYNNSNVVVVTELYIWEADASTPAAANIRVGERKGVEIN
jgi:hypothetical protein